MEIFENAIYWYWFIAGALFLILEMTLPGVLFLWLAIAAAVVGSIVFFMPEIGWQAQILVFAVLAIVAVFVGRSILKLRPIQSENPTLSRRGEQYLGKTFILSEAIIGGEGRIKVDDSSWKVRGDDLPEGTKVTITGLQGNTFDVAKVVDT